MILLNKIERILLPFSQIEIVYKHLRNVGSQGYEGVALWIGVLISETEFEITETIIPQQKLSNSEEGLLYLVEADALEKLNWYLYENKLTLLSQIHSHPNRAYHSETDDKYPIVTKLGGFSIVVPNFAKAPFQLKDWAIFRLQGNQDWRELDKIESSNIFNIIY